MVDMSGHLDTLHLFHNTDDEGSSQIPDEKLDELKRRWEWFFFSQQKKEFFLKNTFLRLKWILKLGNIKDRNSNNGIKQKPIQNLTSL